MLRFATCSVHDAASVSVLVDKQSGNDLAFWPAIDVVLVLEGVARQC